MKSLDEVIQSLEQCADNTDLGKECGKCAYFHDMLGSECQRKRNMDALYYLKDLELKLKESYVRVYTNGKFDAEKDGSWSNSYIASLTQSFNMSLL